MEKKSTTTEIEAPPITAVNCPQKSEHSKRLGQVCAACNEAIPGGGIYTPAEFARYFGVMLEAPRDPNGPTDAEAEMWRAYEAMNQRYNDAVFAVEDLHRDARTVRGPDDDARHRGASITARIEAAVILRDKLRDELHEFLVEINRAGIMRERRARAARGIPGYVPDPEPARGIGERIGAALRGERA